MRIRFWSIVTAMLLWATLTNAAAGQPHKTLNVYGPGGPYEALLECASLFTQRHGIEVVVIKLLPDMLEKRLLADGDIYFGGAEFMLTDFDRQHPGVIDLATTTLLYPRRIGIIVRKGNPLGIRGVEDLSRQGVDLLEVQLENMGEFLRSPNRRQGAVRRTVFTGLQGLNAWLAEPELDAWVTYKSWHTALGSQAEFIEIPDTQALRYLPIALTQRTPHRREALAFITFLQSDDARRIFTKYGWN